MSGDYLWDRTGPRDPDVVRLERLLEPLGQADPAPPLRALWDVPRRGVSWPFLAAAGLAASVVLASIVVVDRSAVSSASGFSVTTLAGVPRIGAERLTEHGRLVPGHWLETDGQARASIAIGDVGSVELGPDSRLGLLSVRPGDYRMHLIHGTLHAVIWAGPGQFSVDTPSATTVDLGCAYTLNVGDDGAGLVHVTSGWVGFEWHGRESFIPAGAECVTRPGIGPGTPYYDDVSAGFRSAIDVLDAGSPTAPDATTARRAALDHVLREVDGKDVVTLWHLLGRVHPDERDRVFDGLARFVPPPPGVTREGIRAGDRAMLDAWWDRLGLGTTAWWRTWKQQWRDR